MPLYLAMTAAEISDCQQLPEHTAYMACHFSPYSTGLSNLPNTLPRGAMVILNDRIPLCGHDPAVVAGQLQQLCEELEAECLLLDLQREDSSMHGIVRQILDLAVCPVGVSELYARDFDCPVFLSMPPMHVPPQTHYAPWEGREIWVEAALEHCSYAVTTLSCTLQDHLTDAPLPCPDLFCHYGFQKEADRLLIGLERTQADLDRLIADERITKAIGLYQQLGRKKQP